MNRSRILIDQVIFCKLVVSFRILQLLLTVSRRSPTHPTARITVQRVRIIPANEVSEGTMKRAPYVCVCVCPCVGWGLQNFYTEFRN